MSGLPARADGHEPFFQAGREGIPASFSRRFSGSPGQALLGGICQRILATGTRRGSEHARTSAYHDKLPAHFADSLAAVSAEIGDGLEV